jgi:hypothetical protein
MGRCGLDSGLRPEEHGELKAEDGESRNTERSYASNGAAPGKVACVESKPTERETRQETQFIQYWKSWLSFAGRGRRDSCSIAVAWLVGTPRGSAKRIGSTMQRRRHAVRTVGSLLAACTALVLQPAVSTGQPAGATVPPDTTSGDLRVSYQVDGQSHSVLVRLGNHSRPRVTASIRDEARKFEYGYEVANEAAAQEPITEWYVLLGPNVLVDSVNQPPSWRADQLRPTSTEKTASTYFDPPGQCLRWAPLFGDLKDASSGSIVPSRSLGSFVISSSDRPGFVRAVFRTYIERHPEDAVFQLPPDAQREAVAYINSVQKSGINEFIPGPAFGRSVTGPALAASLVQQIEEILKVEQFSKDSAFVKEVVALLNRYAADTSPEPQQTLTHSPQSPLEEELALILQVDFRGVRVPR